MAITEKICSKCMILKDISKFSVRTTSSKDGYQGQCKECKNEGSRRWKDANPDKVKEMNRRGNLSAAPYRQFKKNHCESCNFLALDPCQLDVDHIDGNHNNDSPDNLQTLCANCHRLKGKLNGDLGRPKVYKLRAI